MPSPSPREARVAFALLKLRQAQLNNALRAVEPHLDQEPGDRNTAKLGAATLGAVSMTNPAAKATVVDPALFTKFVVGTRPDAVEQTPNETFVRALLQEMDRTGQLCDWDGQEVPGVAFVIPKDPYRRFVADADATELLDVVEPGDLPEVPGVDLAGLLGVHRTPPT